jgi:hypothetical protein
MKKYEEAIICYENALKVNTKSPEIYNDLGSTYFKMGFYNKALENYNKSILLSKSYADAYFNRAMLKLLNGDFEDGWQDYEWRKIKTEPLGVNDINLPHLSNLNQAIGKNVLVYSEQGLGDTIQFSRYVMLLTQYELNVFFLPQKKLITLLKTLNGKFILLDKYEQEDLCDFKISLLSLPNLFNTNLKNIPSFKNYLFADNDRIDYWKKKLNSKKIKIGICNN